MNDKPRFKPLEPTSNYSCKKTSFQTEEYALMFIEKLKKTSKRPVRPCRAYLCSKCLSWHLTSIQGSDVKHLEKYHEKLVLKIAEMGDTIKCLTHKVSEQEATIKCLNEAIIQFRTPKIKKFKHVKF